MVAVSLKKKKKNFFFFFFFYFFFFFFFFFFFKQKTAYEIVVRDWSSDVCSSDLHRSKVDPGTERGHGLELPSPTQKLSPMNNHSQREIGRASCRERVSERV